MSVASAHFGNANANNLSAVSNKPLSGILKNKN